MSSRWGYALLVLFFAMPSVGLSQGLFDDMFASGGSTRSMEPYVDNLASRGQRSLRNADQWKYGAQGEYERCSAQYNRMLQDGVLRINLSFGYIDTNASTVDAQLFRLAYEALTRGCGGSNSSVCGFSNTGGGGHKITLSRSMKMIKNGQPETVRVKINMAYSSLNSTDRENFSGGQISSSQRSVSRVAEDNFFGSISGSSGERCDVCAYYGHARNGGGPDFDPVPYAWRQSDGHPNYAYYENEKRSYKKLLSALQKSQSNPPSLVSVFACYSKLHFWDRSTSLGGAKMSLKAFSANTGFMLTSQYAWPTNWEKNIGNLLEGVLGQKCRSAFDQNLDRLNGISGHQEYFKIYGKFL